MGIKTINIGFYILQSSLYFCHFIDKNFIQKIRRFISYTFIFILFTQIYIYTIYHMYDIYTKR